MAKIGDGGYYRSRIVGAGRQGTGRALGAGRSERSLFGQGTSVMTLLATESWLQLVVVNSRFGSVLTHRCRSPKVSFLLVGAQTPF